MEPRVWLITGGSSGIGAALAEACVEAGDRVAVTSRDPRDLAALWALAPDRVLPLRMDLTRQGDAPAAVDAVLERFGRVDVLVNNAGSGAAGAVEEIGLDVTRELMEILYFGPVALAQAVLPSMRARGTGTILQIGSIAGQITMPGVGPYSAAKAAIASVSEALAGEVAAHGVRVLVAELGAFRTGFFADERLHHSAPIDDAYTASAGLTRAALGHMDGTAPGDPARAADALRRLVDGGATPVRVPVGADAVVLLRGRHEALARDLEETAHLAVDTTFPDTGPLEYLGGGAVDPDEAAA